MSGTEGIGIAGSINRILRTMGTGESSPASQGDRGKKSAGMEGALKRSGDFLRQAMSEAGFVDVHAGNIEKLKMFVKLRLSQEEPTQVSLNPVAAAELAAHAGAQVTGDVNRALRILAEIDPARVAALLK